MFSTIPFFTVPSAPTTTGITTVFICHILCISSSRSLYLHFFSVSFSAMFLSDYYYYYYYCCCCCCCYYYYYYYYYFYYYYYAHKPVTTLQRLLTNIKGKDKPEDRQGAVYKIKCCDCQASYIGETARNLSTRLTEHKRATKNGSVNNHIAKHHLKTKHQIDWDSATCITYSTDYFQRLTLESWFTNLEQTPLNRSQQLPAPYKRLIDEIKQN